MTSGPGNTWGPGAFRGSSARPSTARGVVDHRLARQHLINEFRRGRLARHQVCDAHPELVRAGREVGQPTAVECPICNEPKLVLVTYVFGPRLPPFGRCITTAAEMATLNRRTDQLAAYVVEVCTECSWHHLLRVLPVGGARRRASNGDGG